MSVAIINQTIRAMCSEVKAQESSLQEWQFMTEEGLLYEAAICIISSQILFEMAVATADHLRELGLIRPGLRGESAEEFERRVADALSEPLFMIDSKGAQRWVRPRFKNRLASFLTSTIVEIYEHSKTIRSILFSVRNAKEARELLMQHIWGFGPKQASLFLRRVGYCADLAILDVHVLYYLHLTRGISLSPSKLGRLSFYEEIEEAFREIAADFGHSLGCVDLATWLTMRVVKREALL